jgi:glycosyltransferase involved in cell wall biosynthesis
LSLYSALNPTFIDYEVVVVDDGVTDGTPDILRECEFDPRQDTHDPTEGRGPPSGLERGAEAAKGKYVVRPDADDLFGGNLPTVEVTYLENYRDANLVSPDYYTNRQGRRPSSLCESRRDAGAPKFGRAGMGMESEGSREASVFECEREIKTNMRRSLATKESVTDGVVFDERNLTALRPEDGVSPFRYDEVLGTRATRDSGP